MDKVKEPIMQRIQVGIFGLVVILVMVSVTNFMQADPVPESIDIAKSEEPNAPLAGDEEVVVDEPLAELGVAPPADTEAKENVVPPLNDIELDGPNTAPVE